MTNELATGGTITIDTPTLVEHQFTSGGTFALINPGTLIVNYGVIGGGGGGSGGTSGVSYGSGGAAGVVRTGSTSITSSESVTVGAGGSGSSAPSPGNAGGSSSLGAISTATGGSGAGATGAGGNNADFSGSNPGSISGGGGAGSSASVSVVNGGAGTSVFGTTRAGGGGGVNSSGPTGGTGGSGGGGNGNPSAPPGVGTTNTGSGGGGGSGSFAGAAGGSGIVIIRYDPSTGWSPATQTTDGEIDLTLGLSGTVEAHFDVRPTYARTVAAELFDYDGSLMYTLDQGWGTRFYDEWNGPGTGQISFPISNPDYADLLPGRYINCRVEGISRFTFKIEGNPKYDIIARGEEHEQTITVGGRGWACVLDEALTYPEYALNFSIETTWRVFSFASALFPNAGGWGPAIEQAEYLEGVDTAACYGHFQTAPDGLPYPAPIGFPWPTNPFNLVAGVPTANYEPSYWIRTDDQPTYTSPGYWFFRNEFTLTDFTAVTFTVTGDNFFTFFLEGVAILGEQVSTADHWMWQGWKEHQMWLPAGTYTVAGVVYNIAFSELGATPPYPNQPACPAEGWAGGPRDENSGGLLAVMYVDGELAAPPTFILATDDSWVSHWELDTWPGWTPGQIFQQLIDEAVARDALAVYSSSSFDAADDSNGDPWRPLDLTVDRPDIPIFSVDVGSSLMQALGQAYTQGYINWHVRPETFVVDIFRGRIPPATSVATLAAGVNLRALERAQTAPYANSLLVQWEGGYEVVTDLFAKAAYGTQVEAIYNSDAPSKEEAIVQGQTELYRRAQSQYPAIVAVVEPQSATDCPYEGFTLGDFVNVPNTSGGTEDVRVLSINCQQDDLGYAVWTMELNQKLDVPERTNDQLLQQIGGRNQILRGAVNR